jgi:hypothetical protein
MSGVPLLPIAAAVPWAATPNLFQSVEFLVTVGLLVLILLGGAVVLYFTDVWRKKQLAPDRESAEALTTFRAMYERGEITEAEYEAVRTRVATQLRQEVGVGRPPAPPSGAERAADSGSGGGAGPAGRPPEPPPEPPTG